MKLHGQPLSTSFTRTVSLPRPEGDPLELTLQPLSLGFHRRLRERGIVPPQPPKRIARDSAGKPLRNDQGDPITLLDVADAHYLADLERYHQRVAVLMLVEALAADPHLEFETPAPAQPEHWPAYADAVHDELERAGWRAGDLIWLCDQIGKLSNLIDHHLQETSRNFSSPPPPAS